MSLVYVVPLGAVRDDLLIYAGNCIEESFRLTPRILTDEIPLEPAFDSRRKQYNASTLLLQILKAAPKGVTRIFGLTEGDLFLPIFTFLFGQAQLSGRAAVVSTCRLYNEMYGMPEDRKLFLERVRKEAVHEMGHTFGLVHCYDPRCVMRSSTYVEEIDQKSYEMCEGCKRQMRQ